MFRRKKLQKAIIELLHSIENQNNYIINRINKIENNINAEIGRLEAIICDTTMLRTNNIEEKDWEYDAIINNNNNETKIT